MRTRKGIADLIAGTIISRQAEGCSHHETARAIIDSLAGEGNLNIPEDDHEIFRPLDEWHEDDGTVIFFKLHAGEPPCITDPLSSDWVDNYYTHWLPLPKCFLTNDNYVAACERSGIEGECI